MRKYFGCLVLALTLFIGVHPAYSQTAEEFKAQQKDIAAIKEGQAHIQKDIQEIKKLLKSRPAREGEFGEVMINIKGAPVTGDKNAKLVFMEFTDYQ